MLLSYEQLMDWVFHRKVIRGSKPEYVNATSIDIRLGEKILVERRQTEGEGLPMVSLRDRTPLRMREVDISTEPYLLQPGEFILAHSMEEFDLPLTISAEYKMKSSMGRIGLNHLTSCWCDAGWHDSKLTMELKNETRYHVQEIRAGDLIGQMVFFAHHPVPRARSYAARGRYNGHDTVKGIQP
jgi:dCTP deaminase